MSTTGGIVKRFRTNLGSEVSVNDKGTVQILFDWYEEYGACFDCSPDPDATRDTNFADLIWRCETCGGGSNKLFPTPEGYS